MYYDPNETRSHNCLHNYIVGVRRCGKTYGALKDCIKRYLDRGEEFIYLRRYKTELKKFSYILDPLLKNNEFPGVDLKVKQNKIYVGDKIAGHGIPLSTGKIEKGTNLINVWNIIFDEFIIEEGVYRYLPDETGVFNEFYLSISSYRPVKVFYLANALSISNPYFLKYDLKLPQGKSKFTRKGERLVQLEAEPEFISRVSETRVGRDMIANDKDYAAYAMYNNFLLDNDNFIEKKSPTASHRFNLLYNGQMYGIWEDYGKGLFYCSRQHDPSSKITFAATTADHQPNTFLLKRSSRYTPFKYFIEAYKLGLVRFDNLTVKNMAYQVFKTVTL